MSATVEVEKVRSSGTAVMSWLFEKFAGAAVGSAAGLGMDYVLALVGIKQPPDEVKNRLVKIQEGIDAILAGVEQIRHQLDNLLNALSLTAQEIKKEIGEAMIEPAMFLIEAHYGKMGTLRKGTPAHIDSLGEAVSLRIKAPSQDIDLKTFADNVTGSWDIHGKVMTIASAAAKTTFGKPPLLMAWTDYLLAKHSTTFYDHALTIYRTLESYFQELLAAQFKGVNLVLSAKCYDQTEEAAKPIAEVYLDQIAKSLTDQADLFVQCADKIVLAMFTDPHNKWLYSPGPTKASEDIRTICRRASLVRAIVHAAVHPGSAAKGGICGTVFGRNVDQEDASSRTFTPKGFAASAGDAFAIVDRAGNAPIEWETSTDNKYATLREKKKSGFQAFHYYWPWPATLPEAGKPIDPSFDGGLTPQWYSLDTMEKVDPSPKPGEPKILVADFAEIRFLRGAIFSNPSAADGALVSTPPGKATTHNNENRVGYRNDEVHGIHAMRADETLFRPLAEGSLEGHMNYHWPQGEEVGFTLEFPLFRYKGSQQNLHLAAELTMKLELVEDVIHPWMLMSPRGQFWLTRTRAGASTRIIPLYNTNDRGLSLWGQGSPVHLQDANPFTADVLLEHTGGADDLYSLVLEMVVINQLADLDFDPAHGRHAKGRITYSLKGFRMTWQ